MAESKLETARQLIIEKQYDAARSVLLTIRDHPQAQAWLDKLDEVAPKEKRKLGDLLDNDNPFEDAPYEGSYGSGSVRVNVTRSGRDYTNTAILVLILYWVLWLPGLIVNIIMLNEVNQVERDTGTRPEGKGCLVALLWFNVVPLLLVCGGFLAIVLLASTGEAVDGVFENIIEELGTLEVTPAR